MIRAKNYSVKEIAAMAGVSAGTVDRVIHNRGNVSESSRALVEAVLKKIDYKPNILVSAIGVKRHFNLVAVLPIATNGYWKQIKDAVIKAQCDFSHIALEIKYLHYDQFNLFSCRDTYAQALEIECDAMIIGPTFTDETRDFCSKLSSRSIPYFFVDTMIPETKPLAYFGPESTAMGQVMAKILMLDKNNDKDIVVMEAKRVGYSISNNSLARKMGFREYLTANQNTSKLLNCEYDINDTENTFAQLDKLFADNPNIGSIVFFNSRSYIAAEYLESRQIQNIKLIGCGLIDENLQYLRNGYITCLISERPDRQGSMVVQASLEYLLYGKVPEVINLTPVDILFKENIDFFLNSI